MVRATKPMSIYVRHIDEYGTGTTEEVVVSVPYNDVTLKQDIKDAQASKDASEKRVSKDADEGSRILEKGKSTGPR